VGHDGQQGAGAGHRDRDAGQAERAAQPGDEVHADHRGQDDPGGHRREAGHRRPQRAVAQPALEEQGDRVHKPGHRGEEDHAQQVWASHADIARASLATIPTGPERLRVIEGLLAILRAAGFSDQVAAWAVDRLQIYIDADVFEGSLYAARIKQGFDVEEHIAAVRDYFRRLPADRFPLVSSMADTIMSGDEQRFEFGLDLLLAGLAALR
jgi:hypothetical protein